MYNTSKDASAAAKAAKKNVEKLKEKIKSTTDSEKLEGLRKELAEAEEQQADAEKEAKSLKEFEAELKAKVKFEEKAAKAQDATMKKLLAKSMAEPFPFSRFFGDLKEKLQKGISWVYITWLKNIYRFIKLIIKSVINKNKEEKTNNIGDKGKKEKSEKNNPVVEKATVDLSKLNNHLPREGKSASHNIGGIGD